MPAAGRPPSWLLALPLSNAAMVPLDERRSGLPNCERGGQRVGWPVGCRTVPQSRQRQPRDALLVRQYTRGASKSAQTQRSAAPYCLGHIPPTVGWTSSRLLPSAKTHAPAMGARKARWRLGGLSPGQVRQAAALRLRALFSGFSSLATVLVPPGSCKRCCTRSLGAGCRTACSPRVSPIHDVHGSIRPACCSARSRPSGAAVHATVINVTLQIISSVAARRGFAPL